MEGTGPGFEFQPGHCCGGSILGMIALVSAIQSIAEPRDQPQGH